MTYKIHYDSNPKQDDIQILNEGIKAYASSKSEHKPMSFFAYFIRDDSGKMVGGCSGALMYGSLYVDSLWVDESLRGKGYGNKLMHSAEQLAKESECHFMAVNTMDWEALDFYKKLGFKVEFERKGFDKGSIFYFLRKELV